MHSTGFNLFQYMPNDKPYEPHMDQALVRSTEEGGAAALKVIGLIESGTHALEHYDQRMKEISHLCQIASQALTKYDEDCLEEDFVSGQVPNKKVEDHRIRVKSKLAEIAELRKTTTLQERDISQRNMDFQFNVHQNLMNHQLEVRVKNLEVVKTQIQVIYDMQIKQVENVAAEHNIHLKVWKASVDQWLALKEQKSFEKEQIALQEVERTKIEQRRVAAERKELINVKEMDFVEQEMKLEAELKNVEIKLEKVKIAAEIRRRIAAAQACSGSNSNGDGSCSIQ